MPYIRPMTGISAIAGKQLTIKCPVAGYPIDSVVWEKDNVRLPTNMWQRVHNGALSIENVQRASDQGLYACTARNKHNYTSHRSVEVKVLGKSRALEISAAKPAWADTHEERTRNKELLL